MTFRLLSIIALLLNAIESLALDQPTSESGSIVQASSPACEFVSPGQFLLNQIIEPLEHRLNAVVTQRIDLPHRPRVLRSSGPLRQIDFRDGDRLLAEVSHGSEVQVDLRLRNGHTVAIPRNSLSGFAIPFGEVEVLSVDFEQGTARPLHVDPDVWSRQSFDVQTVSSGERSLKLTPGAEPLAFVFSHPLDGARVQFWFRIEDGIPAKDADGSAVRIAFDFAVGESDQITSKQIRIETPRSTKSVRSESGITDGVESAVADAGWHCITAVFSPQRTLCVMDEALLRIGQSMPGPLRAIRFETNANCWIDDLLVSRLAETPATHKFSATSLDDLLHRPDGDQWFGRVRQFTFEGVKFGGISEDRWIRWQDVSRIEFGQPSGPVVGHMSSPPGLVARMELQPNVDRPLLDSDRLNVTITRVTAEDLSIWHPVLGAQLIAWNDVARIEPRFFGRFYQLDVRQWHLGHAIREDFHRPVPDGIEWSGEFEMPTIPRGDAWLTLNAAELEPSGPDTPPGSPFLNELRSGRLLTELTINDRPVGDLNRWLRFRAPPHRPERIRIRLPPDLIQPGRNSYRLSQVPRKVGGATYDNCELSDLRLEFVESPAASRR